MSDAVLVVLGLVVGAVLTEAQQYRRRKEHLADQQAAESTAQRSWHRDEKREVYAELAVAIDAVQHAAQTHAVLHAGFAPKDAVEDTGKAVLDAQQRLSASLAAAAFVAPVEIQVKIQAFSARRMEEVLTAAIEQIEGRSEQRAAQIEEQTQSLQEEVDALLAALRGDLLDYPAEQVAAEVARLSSVRAENAERIARIAREANARAEHPDRVSDE